LGELSIKEYVGRLAGESREYLKLAAEDLERVRSVWPSLSKEVNPIISGVLNSLASNKEALEIAKKAGLSLERASELFHQWFRMVFEENYDEGHALKLFRIGLAHAKHGVSEKLMILTMGAFMGETLQALKGLQATGEVENSICKCFFWNLCIMLQSYDFSRQSSFSKATGISKQLFERLVRLKADEIYEQLEKV